MREQLAALAHEMWSGWMQYQFDCSTPNSDGTVTIPAPLVERWRRQMTTPYDQLPPNEQNSDRVEADRILAVLSRYLHFQTQEAAQQQEAYNAAQEGVQQGSDLPEHT